MQYVRRIEFDSAEISGDQGYKGKILYSGERCILIATQVPLGLAPSLGVAPGKLDCPLKISRGSPTPSRRSPDVMLCRCFPRLEFPRWLRER